MSVVPRIFILCPPPTAEAKEVATVNKGIAMIGWDTEKSPTTATKEVMNETIFGLYAYLVAKKNYYEIEDG